MAAFVGCGESHGVWIAILRRTRAGRWRCAVAALGLLFGGMLLCAVAAGPLSSYTAATAAQLQAPHGYIDQVLGARPPPPAHDVRREMRERGELK